MHRLRAGGCALAVVVVLLGMWLSPALAVTQTANVVARSHGKVLPADPLLVAGERVQLTITGFGSGAYVTVRLGASSLGTFNADKHGTVTFTFVVPRALPKGTFIVAAVGLPPVRTITPTPVVTLGSSDPQIVEATVPNLGLFSFRYDPGQGSTSASPPPTSPTRSHSRGNSGGAGGSGGTGSTGGKGAGGLGSTGVDVLFLLLIGAAGLVLGWVLLIPGRNRKHA